MNNKVEIKLLKNSIATDMEYHFSKYSSLYKKENSKEREKFFEDNSISTGIYFSVPVLDNSDNHKKSDIKNAEILYKSLSKLTLAQACDVRMWYYLAGTYLYDYVYNYEGAENVESGKFNKTMSKKNTQQEFDDKAPSSFLKSKKNNTYRTIATHYLSRLWWAAYMSEDNGDFSLLKVFTPLPGKMVLTRRFFNNKKIAHATLRALYEYYEYENDGDFSSRDIYNKALKEANIISSSHALDVINEDILKKDIYLKMLDK